VLLVQVDVVLQGRPRGSVRPGGHSANTDCDYGPISMALVSNPVSEQRD
jgi:hypothetical protein